MNYHYKPRCLVTQGGKPFIKDGVLVGEDRRRYKLVSIHPSLDIITLVEYPALNVKNLHQVAPAFVGASITGG